jgi:hypothetical protein
MPSMLERVISGLGQVATALMLVIAGCQLQQAATINRNTVEANRVQLSVSLVQAGLALDRDYKDGKKEVGDVISHHYVMYMYRKAGLLHDPIWAPLDRSLCGFYRQNPRAKEFWKTADKSGFDKNYVDYVEDFLRRDKC